MRVIPALFILVVRASDVVRRDKPAGHLETLSSTCVLAAWCCAQSRGRENTQPFYSLSFASDATVSTLHSAKLG